LKAGGTMLKLPESPTQAIMLGGSFNPPTIAHQAMVEYLLQNTDREIWLVPNGDQYQRKNLAPFPMRVQMLKLLFGNNERVKILETENQGIFQGTYLTLRKLNHPLFVLGADSLADLPTWIKFTDLLRENRFIVFPRGHYQTAEDLLKIIEDNPEMKKYRHHFYIVPETVPAVSSTAFRETFASALVPPKVYRYIQEHNLYQKE
jgi:nicotinate-nucleotide adenylyltransferase